MSELSVAFVLAALFLLPLQWSILYFLGMLSLLWIFMNGNDFSCIGYVLSFLFVAIKVPVETWAVSASIFLIFLAMVWKFQGLEECGTYAVASSAGIITGWISSQMWLQRLAFTDKTILYKA